MRRLLLPACVAAGALGAQPAPRDTGARVVPPDRWLGSDKAKHFFLGGFTYAVSYAGARAAGTSRRTGLAIAVAPAALVSVGKEVRDRRSYGHFSARDLVADALGAAVYAALLAHTGR